MKIFEYEIYLLIYLCSRFLKPSSKVQQKNLLSMEACQTHRKQWHSNLGCIGSKTSPWLERARGPCNGLPEGTLERVQAEA